MTPTEQKSDLELTKDTRYGVPIVRILGKIIHVIMSSHCILTIASVSVPALPTGRVQSGLVHMQHEGCVSPLIKFVQQTTAIQAYRFMYKAWHLWFQYDFSDSLKTHWQSLWSG